MCVLHARILVRGYLIEGVFIQTNMASYELFIERVRDIHKIGAIQGHLGWDQETIMPAKGAKARSEIMSWLEKNNIRGLLTNHLLK